MTTVLDDSDQETNRAVTPLPLLIADPSKAIRREPPEVWLRSFYGFTPETWGFLGFTKKGRRDTFVSEIRNGTLVVIYGATGSNDPADKGRILGVLQLSRQLGMAEEFMRPDAWAEKAADPDAKRRWNYAVKVVRAWRVTDEHRTEVEAFAPETYSSVLAQSIGANCKRLTANDAQNLLELDLFEVPVFGGLPIQHVLEGPGREVLSPTRPGPVSKSPFETKESESPKHLYVLRLTGNESHLLGEPVDDEIVVKVGFSRSPSARCYDHNRTLPRCAFRWEILHSTFDEDADPYDCSDRAIAGENAMKRALEGYGASLGGEFFRASSGHVEAAWRSGKRTAESWSKEGEG